MDVAAGAAGQTVFEQVVFEDVGNILALEPRREIIRSRQRLPEPRIRSVATGMVKGRETSSVAITLELANDDYTLESR